MKKKLKVTWITTAAAVLALSVAGVAGAATTSPSPAATPAAGSGTCVVAAENPQAAAELQALRTDFFEARQAWFDKYGDDRLSDEAQTALQKLRDDRIATVQSVLDKYGIDATAGSRAGEGGHGKGGGMGGGMGMGGGNGACLSAPATTN